MSVAGHLKELRKRLLLALAGITVGAVGGWFLYDPIMDYITAPLLAMEDANTVINFPTIGGGLDLKMRVALWAGILVSSPWWIYQLGAFIMPGLKRREKIYTITGGAVGGVLFGAGATSGVMMIPRAVEILQSFVPAEAFSVLQADTYVDFYLRLVLLFGASFLLPEILVVLNFLGVLSAKAMLHGWRWAVLVAFTFAAIANPLPSPWPMIFQASVLILLYLLAVLISWIRERYKLYGRRLRPRKRQEVAAPAAQQSDAYPAGQQSAGYPVANGPIPDSSYYSGQPYPGNAVSATQVPNNSAVSQMPGVWQTPATSQVPEASQAPLVSQAPVDSHRPGAQQMPISTQEPAGSPVPVPPTNSLTAPIAGVIILAGGTAKRLGGVSKPDVVVGGQRLIDRALAEVATVAPGAPIAVVAPPNVEVPTGIVRVLEDPPLGGPLAGVAAGFSALRAFATYRPDAFIAVLTCDAPLAPRLYPQLVGAASSPQDDGGQLVGGAIPVLQNENGEAQAQYLHGLYRGGALEQLLAGSVRDTSVRSVFRQLRLATVTDVERVGMDVDTWEDAAALEQRL